MTNFGIGIMCFEEDYYFNLTNDKINNLKDSVYILTDNPQKVISNSQVEIIQYNRYVKSYHDKITLIKHILKNHDTAIIIDADMIIKDYSIFNQLKDYQFKDGITYIDTLKNHRCGFEYVRDIQMNPENIDWFNYRKYVQEKYPDYNDLETIYEYFLVVNNKGIKDDFFNVYEKLQVIKESCDIISGRKTIIGAGEGISLHISAKISESQIQRDNDLYMLIKDKIQNINRR